jgi:hypothetical protein
MVQDLVEYYVSQSGNEKGKQVAIELKDTVLIFFSISEDVLIYCLSGS